MRFRCFCSWYWRLINISRAAGIKHLELRAGGAKTSAQCFIAVFLIWWWLCQAEKLWILDYSQKDDHGYVRHYHLKDVENISGLNLLLIKFVVITYWSEMHKRLPKSLACVAGAKRGGGGGGRKGIPLPFFPSSLPPTPSPPPLSTPAMQATKSQRNCRQHVGTPKKDRLHLTFTVVSR